MLRLHTVLLHNARCRALQVSDGQLPATASGTWKTSEHDGTSVIICRSTDEYMHLSIIGYNGLMYGYSFAGFSAC